MLCKNCKFWIKDKKLQSRDLLDGTVEYWGECTNFDVNRLIINFRQTLLSENFECCYGKEDIYTEIWGKENG